MLNGLNKVVFHWNTQHKTIWDHIIHDRSWLQSTRRWKCIFETMTSITWTETAMHSGSSRKPSTHPTADICWNRWNQMRQHSLLACHRWTHHEHCSVWKKTQIPTENCFRSKYVDIAAQVNYNQKSNLTQRGWQRCLREASISNFGPVWPWPLTSWPTKLTRSWSCPMDHLCQLASKSIHQRLKYHVHKIGYGRMWQTDQ